MLTGITITCFAASYSVALALEVTRLFFRARVRVAVSIGFAAAGVLAHSLHLWNRAREGAQVGPPLSTWYDWCLMVAWVLAVLYLVFSIRWPKTAAGLFMLPLILGLVGLSALFRNAEPFSQQHALVRWSMVHGTSLLAGTVVVMLGFVAGIMYLVQSYRLKQKLPPRQGLQLPSLEWLQLASERSLLISSGLIGIGLLSGLILNLIRHAHDRNAVPWTDPVVWTSGILFLWLIVASIFSLLYKPARQGRKVAYLMLASFLFLGLVLGIVLFAPSQHGSVSRGHSSWPTTAATAATPVVEAGG